MEERERKKLSLSRLKEWKFPWDLKEKRKRRVLFLCVKGRFGLQQ